MSFRSKRTRLGIASKSKEIKDRSVEAVVVEVVRDVAAREVDDDEALLSSLFNQSTDQATDQPTQATDQPTKSTYTDANDIRSNMVKSSGRESLGPWSSQPSVTDPSSEFRSSRKHSLRVQDTSVQQNYGVAPRGAQALETDLSSSHNIWMDDPSMNKPRQVTTMEVNDGRPKKRSVADRQFHTPPPNQPHSDDSPSQLRASKRQSFWVHDDVEEPSDRGLSQGRHSKPTNWTDDLEFDEMEEVEMRDLEGRRGKKGGKILPRHVWSLKPGVRFVVPVNALNQPVRKGGHVLVKFLGDVAKNGEFCPIGEVNWHKVDKSCKDNIINLIRDKFVLPAREEIDKSILKHVGKKWRSYRCDLKAQYKKPDKTQEEIASIVPKGVNASQWERLVEYWFSEKSEFLSAKGKEARALQTHLHSTGGKSFSRMRDEFDAGTAMVVQRGSSNRFGANRNKIFGVGGELRKRKYMNSDASGHVTRNKLSRIDAVPKRRDYSALDNIKELDRLSFAMTAMSETNELMQVQIQRQSHQLKMQTKQLQMQSEQMEELQTQLQQVTSLLTKFGVMLNKPQNGPTRRGTSRQGLNVAQVLEASSGYSDSDSDSVEWESD